MTANHEPFASKKGPSRLARAKFGPGMLLQHDDLEALNTYTRDLSRLLFRSFFGCGVVCGLVVSVDEECNQVFVDVGGGVALDGCGDPIHVPEPQRLLLDRNCDPRIPRQLWVVLCGRQTCCAPRTSVCGCDDEEGNSACTRERDGFEIRVVRDMPECACGCALPKTAGDQPHAHPAEVQGETQGAAQGESAERKNECGCVPPEHPCYKDHYDGICPVCCSETSDGACDCHCVLLARIVNLGNSENPIWCVDHRVRRFIRPVLAQDPLPALDVKLCKAKKEKGKAAAAAVYGALDAAALEPPAPSAPQAKAPDTGKATPGPKGTKGKPTGG